MNKAMPTTSPKTGDRVCIETTCDTSGDVVALTEYMHDGVLWRRVSHLGTEYAMLPERVSEGLMCKLEGKGI